MDQVVLVCLRAAEAPARAPGFQAPGFQAPGEECAELVHVSDASFRQVAADPRGRLLILCAECAVHLGDGGDELVLVPPSAEVMDLVMKAVKGEI
jgi:hypothetical protein